MSEAVLHELADAAGIAVHWHDAERRLVIGLAKGSDATALVRKLAIRIATTGASRDIVFDGREQALHF